MIGIVSINEQSLQETSSRVHIGLNSRDNLKYVALEYGQPIKHPDQDLYALIVIEVHIGGKTEYAKSILAFQSGSYGNLLTPSTKEKNMVKTAYYNRILNIFKDRL